MRSVYQILAEVTGAVGWEQLLMLRSAAFVMEGALYG